MRELPTGWAWSRFDAVARVAADLVDPGLWPDSLHLAPNHIEPFTGKITGVKTVVEDGVTSPKHRIRRGQIVYSKIRPYLGKATISPFDGLCSADMYPIDTSIEPAYLLRWMLSSAFTELAAGHQGRSVLPKINKAALETIVVPVAPLREQERIVTAIEETLSKLDAGEAGLRSARQRLKRMRDSVLAAAVSGHLVPQDPSDPPASQLLADLGVEPLEDESLPSLPNSWAWVPLGSVAAMSLGKMLDAKRQTGEYPVSYLRNINVRWFRFDLNDLGVMDIPETELERVSVVNGDLVVCEGGEPGRCAVWRGQSTAIQKALHRVRMCDGVDGQFVAFGIRWWAGRREFDRFITGTTIRHIPKEKLRLLPVPLPPTAEQQRIVAEVDRQLSFIEAAERAVDAGLARSAALRRSVLKAAFEGRLVPQDPSDEPASVLLERIRAERAANPKPQRRQRRSA